MDPSMYSIVSTVITFIIIMGYYLLKKPDFVMAMNEQSQKIFSLRLSVVYALLFSSATGLLVLGICMIEKSR